MTEIQNIPTYRIQPGQNDRTVFDPAALAELAASIQEHGLAQPVLVRKIYGFDQAGNCVVCGEAGRCRCAHYQIVAGERRFRAISTILQRDTVPCIVRELDDQAASAIMLAENIGRKDLDPVDEALAYAKRIQQFGWEPYDIAKRCGVSTERVKRRLKLVTVREDILHLVRSGQFPVGHAEMLSCLDRNRQMIAARPLIEGQPINAKQFRSLVDQLYGEQCSESLLDLALFSGQPVSAQQVAKVNTPSIPVAADLPQVRIPDEHHTGAILYQYIQDLQAQGFTREAETVGTVLYWLDKTNFARLPSVSALTSGPVNCYIPNLIPSE